MLIAVMQSYRIGAMSVSAPKRMRPSISLFHSEWTVGWRVNMPRPAQIRFFRCIAKLMRMANKRCRTLVSSACVPRTWVKRREYAVR